MRSLSICLVLIACNTTTSLAPLTPPVAMPNDQTFPWLFYDTADDHGTVLEKFAPILYTRFSAHGGSQFTLELTAMKSATEWVPDTSKQIDGAIFEGTPASDGSITWVQLARAASSDGVLRLTATSHGDDLLHVYGVQADPASYDSSISPAVEFTTVLTCASGSHDHCAVGAQPGEACTIAPASCDSSFQACIAPDGACGNTGTCVRTDVLCNTQPPHVCTCAGHTFPNRCQATGAHESVRHEGDCP